MKSTNRRVAETRKSSTRNWIACSVIVAGVISVFVISFLKFDVFTSWSDVTVSSFSVSLVVIVVFALINSLLWDGLLRKKQAALERKSYFYFVRAIDLYVNRNYEKANIYYHLVSYPPQRTFLNGLRVGMVLSNSDDETHSIECNTRKLYDDLIKSIV